MIQFMRVAVAQIEAIAVPQIMQRQVAAVFGDSWKVLRTVLRKSFDDDVEVVLRFCFCRILRHFSDSVRLDVESRTFSEPSMANSWWSSGGSGVAETPGV